MKFQSWLNLTEVPAQKRQKWIQDPITGRDEFLRRLTRHKRNSVRAFQPTFPTLNATYGK